MPKKRRARVDIIERKNGLYDWELWGSNGRYICGTVQGFVSEARAREMAERVISGEYADARR